MSLALIVTLFGFGLLATGTGKDKKNPMLMAIGVVLIGLAIPLHATSSAGPVALFGGLALNLGLGAVLMGVVLKMKTMKATPFLLIGTALIAVFVITRAPSFVGSSESGSGTFLLELGPDDTIEEVLPTLEQYGATYEQAFPSVSFAESEDLSKVYIIKGAKKILKKLIDVLLDDTENVDAAELNAAVGLVPVLDGDVIDYRTSNLLANDPLAVQQWSLAAAHINEAHEVLKGITPERKAVVAILDTGVDSGHEDISSTFTDSPAGSDAHGHGTHCAGIAGAATNNGVGIASLNWDGKFVDIKSYAALGSNGMGTIESIAQAIIDATTDGADIISMSLGVQAPLTPKTVKDAVDFALRRDVIIVAAAGNSNQDARHHMPSNIEGVISVAAVDERLRKASFSNTNTSLSRPIAAPGVNIMSLEPAGNYGSKSGTSMATPLVAGLLGVMRAINPSLTADDAYDILVSTGSDGASLKQTGRVINSHAAIQSVNGSQLLP